MRERGGKTLTFVFKTEAASVPILRQRVAPGSTSMPTTPPAGMRCTARYRPSASIIRVLSATARPTRTKPRASSRRLRRAEIGIHHHVAGRISAYAAEMDWREDNRRVSNGEQYLMAANSALTYRVSRLWKGYWQR